MKKLTIFLFIIFFINNKCPMSDWVPVNTGYPNFYTDVHFIDSVNGLACGFGGFIIRTTNGGNNWLQCPTGITNSLYSIRYISNQMVIASGSNRIIIRTTNGGSTWQTVFSAPAQDYNIKNIVVNNLTYAVAVSSDYISYNNYDSYVYKTSDAGATWNVQQVYVGTTNLYFLNQTIGWAYANYFTGPPLNQYYLRVSRTDNGGSNWNVISQSSGLSINPGIIYFHNQNTGFKTTYMTQVSLSMTNNGGYSWTSIMSMNYQNMIRSFWFIDLNNGWFTGENSIIYRTTNGGINWTQQVCPVTGNLENIFFLNNNTGWIAAGSNGLLKTTNGGVYTSLKKYTEAIPDKFKLYQNYPNPFNPKTCIRFAIPENTYSFAKDFPVNTSGRSARQAMGTQAGSVQLNAYNSLGQLIETILNDQLLPAEYEVEWDGSNYPSGMYYYSLIVSDNIIDTKKMVLIK